MKDFAIIIPAYNEEDYLAATLESVREAVSAMPGSGTVVVVDNNSSDRTGEVAKTHGADLVVFEPHNQIARARNAGADSVKQIEHLVFVDADTLITENLLRAALDNLKLGEVAGGGARVLMDQPVTPMVGWIVRTWNRVSVMRHLAAGSFFFCRRDAFDAVGGFDESVYAGEEVWLAKRIKSWGKKRGLDFRILEGETVVTSARKSSWFSTKDFVMQVGLFLLFPWATRSKKLCGMWYRRPDEGAAEG
ncbi:MAG: glycosyltransferase [Verrucomicrobiota bacterium]|nr:glycosyltransferase [Verrucomicrobiota bacterium]